MENTGLQKYVPPTYTELLALIDENSDSSQLQTLAGLDILNIELNRNPPERWIKKHPFLNVKVNGKSEALQYIPIEMHRLLGKRFFGWVGEEILREGTMFQSMFCTVRLHYFHPILQKMVFHDGTGAVDAQTKSGSSAADLGNINPGAVQKGLPAAASFAFNNAYKKFGAIFGQNLQKDALAFNENIAMFSKDYFSSETSVEDLKELYELKKEVLTDEEKANTERILKNKERNSYKKLHSLLSSK